MADNELTSEETFVKTGKSDNELLDFIVGDAAVNLSFSFRTPIESLTGKWNNY